MKLHPTKTLLPSKGNNQQSKRQPKELEKIFANHAADKGSRIYKELQNLYAKNQSNLKNR